LAFVGYVPAKTREEDCWHQLITIAVVAIDIKAF
jgi:hypothetical protein